MKFLYYLFVIAFISSATISSASEGEVFSDETLSQGITLPEWFKLSFLDLKDDLIDAETEKKQGIILYFGRKDCPYCKRLLENTWGQSDIAHYTRTNFDVIAVNTKGVKSITDFDGYVYDEKDFALKMKTNFTPSILFYNLNEELVLKLSGYQSPYRFMAALEYVADKHYKKRTFASYLAQAKDALSNNGNEELNYQPYFESPPFNLNRSIFTGKRPLAVFFERKYCHACDILHANPLENKNIQNKLGDIDVIQVDISDSQRIITPKGNKTTVAEWAAELELHYTPTIIFFDESGNEIIRIDSVVWVNRLDRVLAYISSRAYKKHPSFQAWRNISSNK